ncbi:unnamed protein product (macronuclear) [Paramecium tetraurelia]|uniref:Uncharacterized protein n=1 Tax=Paramecium tetraurelia TaxID=5888 RepID=A0E2Y4_PARTE|nr:uncharacterized protein GSPATT00022823001 [Paramecium tetraurelia]CAK89651.1 unnamed protein product [Paramecium tetraurelia]|eukprot:XP_001457048.1 hypothetical protein (macronuclear) [Paramecium tetraurelia strain d4-2]
MISEFDFNYYPLQLYDLQIPLTSQLQFENFNENDVSARKLRVSSQCLILKKYEILLQTSRKIRRKQKRPSLLKIDETARNVKIYNLGPSQTNLECTNDEQKQIND